MGQIKNGEQINLPATTIFSIMKIYQTPQFEKSMQDWIAIATKLLLRQLQFSF